MRLLENPCHLSELDAQRLLVRVYEAVLAGAPFDESLSTIFEILREGFPQFRVAYSTIDPQGCLLVQRNSSVRGMPEVVGLGIDLSRAPEFLSCLREGRVLVVRDVRDEPVIAPLVPEFTSASSVAVVELPIFSVDSLVGLLCIDSPVPYDWAPYEVDLLTRVALQLKKLHQAERTDRANREIVEALAESEGRFREIAEHINVVIWMSDPFTSEVLYVSPAYERVWGRSSEELYQSRMGFLHAVHPDDRDIVLRALPYQVRGTYDICYRVVRPDLTTRWVRDRAYPVCDEKGDVYRLIGVAEDITVQKLLELDLMQAKQEADQHASVKSDFLAVMSHEIRTPLNGVVGLAELMLDTKLDAEQRDLADSIISSGRLLSSIVNDILDFSKLEAQKAEIEQLVFSPRRVVEMLLTRFAPDLKRKGLKSNLQVGSALSEQVIGDPTRYEQIVSNLVSNAIKFTPSGTIDIRLNAEIGARDVAIETAVQDCGIGIPPDKLPYLFEPFTQVDASTARRFGGTGLGLAICKRLVHAMDGEISVESTPGRGACFRFTIRCGRLEDSVSDILDSQPTALHPSPRRDSAPVGGAILLVEDNVVNQKVASKILERSGYRVTIAGNGAQALELFESDHFSLILMDCNMPDMDGFEVTRRIRESTHKHNTIPVVALTALAMPGDRERCLAAGMTGYLSKPINAGELRDKIVEVLSGG